MEDTLAQYKVSTREETIEKYREWVVNQPEIMSKPKPCHEDVLAELADRLKIE